MRIQEMEMANEKGLVLDPEMLDEAGLTGRLRVLIQEREIRILPETEPDPEQVLRELAGCLGEEPAASYDFHLDVGSYYEARRSPCR